VAVSPVLDKRRDKICSGKGLLREDLKGKKKTASDARMGEHLERKKILGKVTDKRL